MSSRPATGSASTTAITALAMIGSLLVGGAAGWIIRGESEPTSSSTSLNSAETESPTPSAQTSDEPETHKLTGTLQLTVDRNPRYPENCLGFDEEGFGDMYVGQQVVITDGAGLTIGAGKLTSCKYHPIVSPGQARGLLFKFSAEDVPDSDFYKISVGTGQRGAVTYSKADLESAGWHVELNL